MGKKINFINNSIYLLVNSFINFIFRVFSNVIIVRYIGVNNNGIYAYLYAVSAIFSCITEFGLETIIVRESINRKYDHKVIIGTALFFRFTTSFLAGIFFLIYVYSQEYGGGYFIFALCIAASYSGHIGGICRTYMISQYNSKDFFFGQNVCTVLFFAFKLLFVYYKLDFVFIFIINASEFIISSLIYYFIYGNKYGFKLSFSFEVLLTYLKEGFWLTIASVAVIFYIKCDQVMLRNILGENALGIYAIAVSLAEFWYFIPTTINSAISPRIISCMKSENDRKVENCFGIYFRFMFLLSFVAGIIITFLAKLAVLILYGEMYLTSVPVLRIYIWAGIFVCMGVARSNYLIFYKYNVFNSIISIVACIINVVLNYLLIPVMFELGAAIATVITYFFSAILSSILWTKTRKIGLVQLKAMFYPYILKYLLSKKNDTNNFLRF